MGLNALPLFRSSGVGRGGTEEPLTSGAADSHVGAPVNSGNFTSRVHISCHVPLTELLTVLLSEPSRNTKNLLRICMPNDACSGTRSQPNKIEVAAAGRRS